MDPLKQMVSISVGQASSSEIFAEASQLEKQEKQSEHKGAPVPAEGINEKSSESDNEELHE